MPHFNYNKVTISGKICTGKTTLFWDLVKHLGWPTFSAGQFFRDYARIHNLSLEGAEEQTPKLTKEVDQGMQKLLEKEGYIIIEGWMAGIMADKMPGVLRILLTCGDNERFQRFARREKISLADAQKRVLERDQNWFEKLKSIYRRNDFFDPKKYNFILDTTNLTPKLSLQRVLEALVV